jgi:hypothetical protein
MVAVLPVSTQNQIQASEKPSYSTQVGFGYGNSFGGLGFTMQGNLSDYFSVHGGIGYFSLEEEGGKGMVLVSAGIKVYTTVPTSSRRLFFNAQFGSFGGAYIKSVTFSSGEFSTREEQKPLYGPSLLAGMEVNFGRESEFGLSLALGGSYDIAEIDWKKDRGRVLLALDVGLLYRF